MTREWLRRAAWGVTGTVCLLAAVAWWDIYSSARNSFSAYSLFPLLGLLAFSIMWAHYMVALVREWFGQPKEVVKTYFDSTSAAVLVLILLHPGLLIWSLWRDGLGLPPGSTKLFVGATLYGFVVLGMIALVVFVAYELRRFIQNKRWRQVLQYASDVAMLLIVIHGFRLGMVTQETWFGIVWWFYAATLLLSLGVRSYLHAKA